MTKSDQLPELMTRLLIMYCPYCGSRDVSEINRVEGHMVESAACCCLGCDEEFSVDRNLDPSDDCLMLEPDGRQFVNGKEIVNPST